MESKALVVMNYRQLALVYEQMESIVNDSSIHTSQRQEAEGLYRECASLMGREVGMDLNEN